MSPIHRWLCWICLLLSPVCEAQGTSRQQKAKASSDKVLRIAYFSHDLSGIDPLANAFDPDSYSVISQIFDSLLAHDLDGNLLPALATDWRREAPTKWIFTLRKGVKFHNGEIFDAEAVKFSLDTYLDPTNHLYNGFVLRMIKSITVINPYELAIETYAPDGMLLSRLSSISPIFPPKTLREKGLEAFHKHPIGTGPFQFESWTHGKEVTLVANKSYWKTGTPHLDRVRFLILPEKQWASALEKDQVDLVPQLKGNLTRRVVVNSHGKVRIVKRTALVANLGMIKLEGPLADLKVRKAINYALDRNAMVKYADFGNAIPSASLGKIGEIGQNPDLQPYPYDPAQARALLASSSSPLPIKLKLLASDGSGSVAKIMKTNLKAVGIDLKIDLTSTGDLIRQLQEPRLKKKPFNYDLAMLLADSPTYSTTFLMEAFLMSKSASSMLNRPEFDEMLRQATEAVDEKGYERKLRELDRYIYDQSLLFFTTQRIITAAVRDRFNINKLPANGHLDSSILLDADLVEKTEYE
jgi:peptide/nickel transport system substrate-binding protein